MEAKVLELIKDIGFNITSTSDVYGVEDARVIAEKDGRTIRTSATSTDLVVIIRSVLYDSPEANFYFLKGRRPDLHFREYTPELLEIARRFGAVAGFDI